MFLKLQKKILNTKFRTQKYFGQENLLNYGILCHQAVNIACSQPGVYTSDLYIFTIRNNLPMQKRVMLWWLQNLEWNGLFYFVLFRILLPEAILYLSLDPKHFDLGIPNPKSKLFVNSWKITERFVPFRSGFL